MKSLWRIWQAFWMAYWGHRRQRDKAGRRYVFHVAHVAWIAYGMTGDPEAAVVGLLHDYFEDVGWSVEARRRFGLATCDRIEMLTHAYTDPYERYIRKVGECGDRVVLAVKIADLLHNTDTGRGTGVNPARTLKYLRALDVLVAKRATLGQV